VSLAGKAFRPYPEDLKPLLAIPKDRLRDVTFVMYHSWETSRCRAAAIDAEKGVITFTAPIPWGFNYWGPHQRYHVDGLDQQRHGEGPLSDRRRRAHDGCCQALNASPRSPPTNPYKILVESCLTVPTYSWVAGPEAGTPTESQVLPQAGIR